MDHNSRDLGAIDEGIPTATVEHVADAYVRRYVPGRGALADAAMDAIERELHLRLVPPGHVSGDRVVLALVSHGTEQAIVVGDTSLSVLCRRGESAPRVVAETIAVSHGKKIAWVERTPEDAYEYEVALVEEGADWPAVRVRFSIINEGEVGGGPLWPAEPGTLGDRPFFVADLPSALALCIAEHYRRAVRHERDAATAAVAHAMFRDLERRGVSREAMHTLRALICRPVGADDG